MIRLISPIFFSSIIMNSTFHPLSHNNNKASALLLSDIPTPSFVIDLDALMNCNAQQRNNELPPYLHLPTFDKTLSPMMLMTDKSNNGDNVSPKSTILDTNGIYNVGYNNRDTTINHPIVGYLHSSVIRAREDANEYYDAPTQTFLAEVDLPQSLCYYPTNENENNMMDICNHQNAQLVLGLNNHHVGSYYWARSAGAGASMEAPGISFRKCSIYDDRGILRWESDCGPLDCNSNDGKRSEWVNFLRIGDNVQFVPRYEEQSIMAFLDKFGYSSVNSRIFGISAKGRPLGSEPVVTCKWVLHSNNSWFSSNDNSNKRIRLL